MNCLWCEEPLDPKDECRCLAGHHHECATRTIRGSVGHQLCMCSCFGGKMEDRSGLSRREAAREAMHVAIMLSKNEAAIDSIVSLAEALAKSGKGIPCAFAACKLEQVIFSERQSITCPRCRRTSYNLNDVRHRYCGACHEFHDIMAFLGQTEIPIDHREKP